MLRFMVIVALVCFVKTAVINIEKFGPDVKTVDKLDIPKYLGRWYEIYRSLIPNKTYEKDSLCTTATYGLRPDGKISVLNSGRIGSPDGEVNNITGYAYAPDPKEPGKFKLHFPTNDGDYWVVKLGPETFGPDGMYQYSVITSDAKLLLFVLARDPVEFKKKYEAEVLSYLKDNGYNYFWNKPIRSYQGPDCKYPA